MCLADDCYTLTFYDDYGDGMYFASNPPTHQYKLYDDSNNMLVEQTDFKGNQGSAISAAHPNICLPYSDAPPVVDFDVNTNTIVAGGIAEFTDLTTANPAVISLNWSFEGGTANSTTIPNPEVTYDTPGVYSVTLTADNGIGVDSEIKIAYITVTESPGCDTINFPPPGTLAMHRSVNEVIAPIDTNYYRMGYNQYGDLSKAEKFKANKYAPYTTLKGALLYFAYAIDGGNNSTVDINVWNDNAGSPGSIIGTKSILLSDIESNVTNNFYTSIFFDAPIAVSGDIYIGYPMNLSAGDSLGLVHNTPLSDNEITAFEEWNDNTWHDVKTAWGGSYNINLYISGFFSDLDNPADFSMSSNEICAGDSIYIDGNSSQITDYWYWDILGDGNVYTIDTAFWMPYDNGGSYDIELFALGGCGFDSITKTLVVNTIDYTFEKSDVSCFGFDDGSVTITPNGDGTNYTYQWSDGVNNSDLATGLTPTEHNFTITDNNQCEISGNVTISEPNVLTVTLAATSVTSNGGNDGSVTANASGGSTDYTYAWLPGNYGMANPSGLNSDTYCVTVTDAKNCSITDCIYVPEPNSPLNVDVSSINELCDALDGSAIASATGGTGTYFYSWDDNNSQSTSSATGLSNGIYNVTVDDGNETIIRTVTVSETPSSMSSTTSSSDENCTAADGTASIVATNGTQN